MQDPLVPTPSGRHALPTEIPGAPISTAVSASPNHLQNIQAPRCRPEPARKRNITHTQLSTRKADWRPQRFNSFYVVGQDFADQHQGFLSDILHLFPLCPFHVGSESEPPLSPRSQDSFCAETQNPNPASSFQAVKKSIVKTHAQRPNSWCVCFAQTTKWVYMELLILQINSHRENQRVFSNVGKYGPADYFLRWTKNRPGGVRLSSCGLGG